MNKEKEGGNKKKVLIIVGIIVAVIGALIAGSVIKNGKMCQFDGCENESLKTQGISESEYCNSHDCEEDGCLNPIEGDNDYCKEHINNHTCEGGIDCTNKAIEGYDVCEEHSCRAEDCYEEVYGSAKYCLDHQCDVCKKPTAKYSDMCSDHKNYERCNSCDEYKSDVSLRTIAGGDTEDYTGEDYDWCSDCWEEYKELSIYD